MGENAKKERNILENKLFPNILIGNKIEFQKYILTAIIAAQHNSIALKLCSKKFTENSDRSTRMGFEPTRAEHNGLAVHRLNHSATSSQR